MRYDRNLYDTYTISIYTTNLRIVSKLFDDIQ